VDGKNLLSSMPGSMPGLVFRQNSSTGSIEAGFSRAILTINSVIRSPTRPRNIKIHLLIFGLDRFLVMVQGIDPRIFLAHSENFSTDHASYQLIYLDIP
jgi:hypothetical protein